MCPQSLDLFAYAAGAYADDTSGYAEVLRARDGWSARTVPHHQAADLVERLHYAGGAANTSTLACGLVDPFGVVVGAALWMPPPRGCALWVSRATGCDPARVVTLSRLAIEDEVPRNGASFLLSRSARVLRADGWQVAVTFADGLEGHTGAVYLASGWTPAGYSPPRVRWVDPSGRMRSRRAGRNMTAAEMRARGWSTVKGKPKARYLLALSRRFRQGVASAFSNDKISAEKGAGLMREE